MERMYKAKVGDLFVKNVYTGFKEISLTPYEDRAEFFNEDKKEYLLELIPNAKLRTYTIENENW